LNEDIEKQVWQKEDPQNLILLLLALDVLKKRNVNVNQHQCSNEITEGKQI
jgi:hypothetical protein